MCVATQSSSSSLLDPSTSPSMAYQMPRRMRLIARLLSGSPVELVVELLGPRVGPLIPLSFFFSEGGGGGDIQLPF